MVDRVVNGLVQWIVHTLAGPPIVPSLADVGQEPASSLPSPSYLQDGDNETIEMMMMLLVGSFNKVVSESGESVSELVTWVDYDRTWRNDT